MTADAAMVVLFSVALVVAVLVPAVGYTAPFLMLLMGPAQRVMRRVFATRWVSAASRPETR